jgi:hypothetical protein
MLIEKIDIKSDMPPADVAVATLQKSLVVFKGEGVKVVLIIHGYGSHGSGGEIKRGVHLLLQDLKNKKQILNYVKGESWGHLAMVQNDVFKLYPQLILNENLQNFNSGVTVVFL